MTQHFMRVLASHVEPWLALGWRIVAGHRSPSVGDCLLLHHTAPEPLDPTDAMYLDLGGEA